jgi:hypothetical protein
MRPVMALIVIFLAAFSRRGWTAEGAIRCYPDQFAARTMPTRVHISPHKSYEELMRDCEDRCRCDGAYGERTMLALAFRHRAYQCRATGSLRDGDQT